MGDHCDVGKTSAVVEEVIRIVISKIPTGLPNSHGPCSESYTNNQQYWGEGGNTYTGFFINMMHIQCIVHLPQLPA